MLPHALLTKEDVVPQTVDRKTVRSWTEELDALNYRIAPLFSRSEVRRRARDYLRGLLSGLSARTAGSWPRWRAMLRPTAFSTCWVEPAGTPTSYVTTSEATGSSIWATTMGVPLIVDETGFIKKGHNSVGVKRQYTGTAGKTEN